MTGKRPLSGVLARLYFWGWVGLALLTIIVELITSISYNWQFRCFLEGLWIGLVNLGVLWAGIFLSIVIGHVVVSITWGFIESGNQNREHIVRSFGEEFREVYGLGWTILIVISFVSEFLAESYGFSGGLFPVVAFGFLPMTAVAALLAYICSRARLNALLSLIRHKAPETSAIGRLVCRRMSLLLAWSRVRKWRELTFDSRRLRHVSNRLIA